MRNNLGIIGLCLGMCLYGQAVFAMTPQSSDPIPLAPAQKINNLNAIPVDKKSNELSEKSQVAEVISEWEVDEFRRDNGFPTGECIMRANYTNNLEITFKGTKGQLSALRVKDNSQSGIPRVKGFLALGLDGNSFGLQSRSISGQIDASLLTVPAPAEKIMDLDNYELRIGTKDYLFSTEGFAYAYQKLLKCHGYENARTLQVVSSPRAMPIKTSPKVIKLDKETKEPIDVVNATVTNDYLPDADDIDENLSVRMETWTANKGDKLSSVLETWANKANVKPEINLANDVALDRDFKIFGPLDIAVNQLLNDTLGKNASSAYLENSKGNITKISEINMANNSTKALKPIDNKPVEMVKWRALQGTDLRKVLKKWSSDENVDLIWDADQTFLIKKTMKTMSDYNGAVAILLSQYSNQGVKPKGTLNVDPKTGRKSLVISVEQSS